MIRPRRAFTLVELLVAMGIAALLAAVVFAVYAGVLGTLDAQSRWRSAAYPASAALDALALDLAGAMIPWGATNPPFVLVPPREGAAEIMLHFYSAAPMKAAIPGAAQTQDLSLAGRDLRAYAAREMFYALPASNAAGPSGLVRAWQAFRAGAAGGSASNRDVWQNVRAIRLEVFDGTQWTNAWGAGTNACLPLAARVVIAAGNESANRRSAEILIPAGHRIAAPQGR